MIRWSRRCSWGVLATCLLTVAAGMAGLGRADEKPDDRSDRWCLSWTPTLPKDVAERAALIRALKWPSAAKISISFLDGDPAVQKKVMEQAVKWTREAGGPANLIFEFQRDQATDVRITFKYRGSWSAIGKGCQQVTADRPTMNLGWLTAASKDVAYRRIVMHEFGHVIGMIHEHQNPAGGIEWNRPVVMKALSGPPWNWKPDFIESNMFKPYAAGESNFTRADPKSIMLYPIPAGWTRNGFSAELNTELSELDRQFIREQYP